MEFFFTIGGLLASLTGCALNGGFGSLVLNCLTIRWRCGFELAGSSVLLRMFRQRHVCVAAKPGVAVTQCHSQSRACLVIGREVTRSASPPVTLKLGCTTTWLTPQLGDVLLA